VHSVAVNIDPPQFLSGWHPEIGALFLPTLSEARVGEEVAVRVGIYGQSIRATLFGKVSLVRRVGRPALPPGVELRLDRASLPAASFLAMASRGEPVSFTERRPRFSVARPLSLVVGPTRLSVVTLNVSEGGCAVRWDGPLPLVGDVVPARIGDGFFAPTARAVVCWNQPGGTMERSVGLRIIGTGRAGRAWRAVVAAVARSGARAA
jgi:PilZ domain